MTTRNTARHQLIVETGREVALHAKDHGVDPLAMDDLQVLRIATIRLDRVPSVRMQRYLSARVHAFDSAATRKFARDARRFAASLIDGGRA